MCMKRLGQRHPGTAISMMKLAVIWKDMGRRDDAIGLIHTCFYIRQELLGAEHLHTMSTLLRLKEWCRDDKQLPV